MSLNTRRYVQDLLELAKRGNKEAVFADQLEKIYLEVNENRKLYEHLDSVQYSSAQKKARLQRHFHNELDNDVLDAFFMVNNMTNMTHTEISLLHDFVAYSYQIKGILYGTVYSVRPLNRETITRIEKAISSQVDGVCKLINVVDESLLAGVRVVINDMEWDGSYATRLKKMKKELTDEITTATSESELQDTISEQIARYSADARVFTKSKDTVGYVSSVADGIIKIRDLNNAMAGELLEIGNSTAMVMNLEENSIGAVLLDDDDEVLEGAEVYASGKVVEVPVGDALLGRVVDALGRPIDGKGIIKTTHYYPIERRAPGVIQRQSVNEPLETGIKIIDSMIPIGKGQRELIIGDRQTGKTAIAIDTILNQKGKNVFCIYVAIGQKNSYVAQIVQKLRQAGAMEYTTVVLSSASELASLQYIAPYAGCAIGEYWMEHGKDVLIVYDDLSKHAIAYRTLSLLLRRPPGREAYPGDVFYLHSRLLERSAKLSEELGGGSLTALPIVETQAGDISAYIPTNVISITDGQIFLQTELFNSGFRPAVDSGLSVSRVGSAAQRRAMKKVSGSLKLDLAQYQEVLDFAQFGSDLDPVTQKTINHGQRLMAMLKQPQYSPVAMEDQIIMLLAAQNGHMEDLPVEAADDYEKNLLAEIHTRDQDLISRLRQTWVLDRELEQALLKEIGIITERYRQTQMGMKYGRTG